MNRRASGFTLIEVLLATMLLAAGLALAFATLRSATAIVQRGETVAQQNERMRAVQGFLRRRLASAQAIGFATAQDTARQYRFIGEPARMRFVADLPDYLGRGGPYLHDVAIVDEGRALQVSLSMVQAGQTISEATRASPELLADGLKGVRFLYRGLAPDGKLGPWEERWTAVETLPVQVAIEGGSAQGRAWPPMVVSLAQGTGQSGGTDLAPLP